MLGLCYFSQCPGSPLIQTPGFVRLRLGKDMPRMETCSVSSFLFEAVLLGVLRSYVFWVTFLSLARLLLSHPTALTGNSGRASGNVLGASGVLGVP